MKILISHPDHQKRKEQRDVQALPNAAYGPKNKSLHKGIGQHDEDGPNHCACVIHHVPRIFHKRKLTKE
jgi:hypothetical protein